LTQRQFRPPVTIAMLVLSMVETLILTHRLTQMVRPRNEVLPEALEVRLKQWPVVWACRVTPQTKERSPVAPSIPLPRPTGAETLHDRPASHPATSPVAQLSLRSNAKVQTNSCSPQFPTLPHPTFKTSRETGYTLGSAVLLRRLGLRSGSDGARSQAEPQPAQRLADFRGVRAARKRTLRFR